MESKKISFGFKKTQKSSDSRMTVPPQNLEQEEQKDYIDCLEGNSIKIFGGKTVEEKKPLVIPMKPNTLTAERFQEIAAEVESAIDEISEATPEMKELPVVDNETLEQQAARELLEESKNIKRGETQVLSVKIPSDAPLTGQKEPTLDDYEAVPISDYGLAMLRGMGWTPGQSSKYTQPVLRPKGLGLGADKMVKIKEDNKGKRNEEELKLTKGSFVRVLAGKYSGAYGKVVSLNDESARVTVELALGRNHVEIGEQLLELVTRDTYNERSKILNSDKYEEYKRKEENDNVHKSNSSKKSFQSNHKDAKEMDKAHRHNQRNERRDSTSSEEAYKRKSIEKLRNLSDSDSEYERKRRTEYRHNNQRNNGEKYRNDKQQKWSDNSLDESSSERDERRDKRNKMRDCPNSGDRSENKYQHKLGSSSNNEKSKKKHVLRGTLKECSSESHDSSQDDQQRKKSKRSKMRAEKRDIDKKRKGKKKKRDRDRSPTSRKHKK